jgi:hypothetical protein
MIGAIVKDNIVENLIVLDEAQKAELEAALGCEIVDARPYGLIAGDLRTAAGWTRNAGGEQMVLELQTQEAYDSYTLAAQRAADAEAALETAGEAATAEALNILKGDVSE